MKPSEELERLIDHLNSLVPSEKRDKRDDILQKMSDEMEPLPADSDFYRWLKPLPPHESDK